MENLYGKVLREDIFEEDGEEGNYSNNRKKKSQKS